MAGIAASGALCIAVVSYVSYSIGTTLAARTEDRINANQGIDALGLFASVPA